MLTVNTNKPYKIYAEHGEFEALKQFENIMNLDCVVKGALQADFHVGYTMPIGAVAAVDGQIFPSFVGFDIGCLDGDTEYLTRTGWKKIKDYDNEEILQYNLPTDTATFVTPLNYICKPTKGFYHLLQMDGVDQKLSADHKVLFFTKSGKKYSPKIYTAKQFVEKQISLKKGIQGGFKTTFDVAGILDKNISDELIRIIVMVSADGHIRKSGKVELHFRKERKIQRSQKLLDDAGIEYTKTIGVDGSTFIYFKHDDISSKELSQFWDCSARQLKIISEESLLWDGHVGNREFFTTTNKQNADLIQYAFAVNNVRCGLYTRNDERENYNAMYTVQKTKNNYVAMSNIKNIEFETSDENEYCFTVPTGFFVARRSNKIFITGNCGMGAVKTSFKLEDVKTNSQNIFDEIYKVIPTGFNINVKSSRWSHNLKSTDALKEIYKKNGDNSLGSLGSGNHFIEIGHDENNEIWIIVHSGSRNLGHSVATHYMKIASNSDKAKEGAYGMDVNSQNGKDYITDMNFCCEYAIENRRQILHKVEKVISNHCSGKMFYDSIINRNHNHAELKDGLWIHRKGATHAEDGMMGVIPGNMRDGSFIVRGKGNPDSLYSSSHGAGRVMSRSKAKENISMDDFKESMDGIVAKVTNGTLDESAFAYKDIFEVMDNQKELVDVVHHVKPIINIKG